jgi:hypothetical protein
VCVAVSVHVIDTATAGRALKTGGVFGLVGLPQAKTGDGDSAVLGCKVDPETFFRLLVYPAAKADTNRKVVDVVRSHPDVFNNRARVTESGNGTELSRCDVLHPRRVHSSLFVVVACVPR